MQFIAQSYNGSAANTSGCFSPISISSNASSISSISSTCPDSPMLPHLFPPSLVPSTRTFRSPTLKKLTFGTAKYFKPICLCLVTVEDTDSEDEDQLILLPANIIAQCPKEVLIKVKCFEAIHNARETKAKQYSNDTDHPISNITDTSTSDTILSDANTALVLYAIGTSSILANACQHLLHITQQLEWLSHIFLHGQPTSASNQKPEEQVMILYDLSGWDYNNDSKLEHLWPAPSMTPSKGDNMHPLQMSVCSTHPRQGWELNDPLAKNYYRFLILDLFTKHLIVASFISYNFGHHDAPSISGTYGSGYPIYTYLLTPTLTDYVSPTITPEQLCLLDTKEPFANGINHVINKYFPLNLSATVCQYQYYCETEYAIQHTICTLQDKKISQPSMSAPMSTAKERTSFMEWAQKSEISSRMTIGGLKVATYFIIIFYLIGFYCQIKISDLINRNI